MKKTTKREARWREAWKARQPAVNVPPATVALKACELAGVAPQSLLPAELVRFCRPTPDELSELRAIAAQAVTVAFDVMLQAAQDGAMVFVQTLVDELAERWSPSFRQAAPADTISQTRLETAEAIRAELLVQGIDVDRIWRAVVGSTTFYTATIVPRAGYKVTGLTVRGLALNELLAGAYLRPAERRPTLLLADEAMPPRRIRREVAGEQPFNVVDTGARSAAVLDRLEATRLVFHADVFREDYEVYRRLAAIPRKYTATSRKLWDIVKDAQDKVDAFGRIAARLEESDLRDQSTVLIKSRFSRAINRRMHSSHFFPEHVSDHVDIGGTSPRARWFSFPNGEMIGYDVSSSQTQLLAVLLNIPELEEVAGDPAKPFKVTLSEHFYAAQERGELQAARREDEPAGYIVKVKELWTRRCYGSEVRQVIRDNARDWFDSAPFVEEGHPDFERNRAAHAASLKAVTDEVTRVLALLPWYADVMKWFDACKAIADQAMENDPHHGVDFVDPYGHELVVFNPTETGEYRFHFGHQSVVLRLPGRKWKGEPFKHAAQKDGMYPVSKPELKQSLAPMLVHMLDASMSSRVIEIITTPPPGFGSKHVHPPGAIALHDCWMVPGGYDDTLDHLREAFDTATRAWFNDLGAVYDRLIELLGDHPVYGPWVAGLREKWETRLKAGAFPRIALSPS